MSFVLAALLAFLQSAFTIPAEMRSALTAFNSKFQPWTAEDYSPEVRRGIPFALSLDVNRDGINDLILDGRDDRNSLLLGIVSRRGGYDVHVIQELDLVDPRKKENQFDGKREYGLAYYLLPGSGDPDAPAFMIATPQQSTATGELLNDGGVTEVFFKNGSFEVRYGEPL